MLVSTIPGLAWLKIIPGLRVANSYKNMITTLNAYCRALTYIAHEIIVNCPFMSLACGIDRHNLCIFPCVSCGLQGRKKAMDKCPPRIIVQSDSFIKSFGSFAAGWGESASRQDKKVDLGMFC